jgi:structure-specific endonuclease subunit SLX1
MNYCYILYNDTNNKTYNGYTVNPARRIRQHNKELKGGAKYTTNNNVDIEWKYLLIIESNDFDKHNALCFEWMIKYPTRKKPRPKEYQGILGRLKSLPLVLSYYKFENMNFIIKINSLYLKEIENILENFKNRVTIEILL